MVKKALSYVGRHVKLYRSGSAILFALLALIMVMGVAQASGPMRPTHPPYGGMWGWGPCSCLPEQPVPLIHIVSVVKNESVTIETEDFPKNEDFTVTMGYIYTRGVDGIVVGDFNSAEGESATYTFEIPEDFKDVYRLSIRAETDHTCPYRAFNWFYNNSTIEEEEV